MKKILMLTFIAFIAFACKNSAQPETQEQQKKEEIKFEWASYENSRFDFSVSYPDFLIPQGESGNGDGQRFISEDEKFQFWAYVDFKMNATFDDAPSFDEAYEQDVNQENVEYNEKRQDNYYVSGHIDKNTLFSKYTYFRNMNYYVLYFQFPDAEARFFSPIVDTIVASFDCDGGENHDVENFINGFLKDCWIGKNFDALLRDNSAILNKYIDKDLGIARLHAPGTIPRFAKRNENFGYDNYTDFETTFNGKYTLTMCKENYDLPCNFDFEDKNGKIVCYDFVSDLPSLVDPETFEISSLTPMYPSSKIMLVYLPNKYNSPRAFYFILVNKNWKLIIVDDTLCSA